MQYLGENSWGIADNPPMKPEKWVLCVPGAADIPGPRFREADGITVNYVGRCQRTDGSAGAYQLGSAL